LGEKTNRTDDIYNGIKFDMEMHLHRQAWFAFQKAIIARAKRESPDTVINITSVFAFPSGETPTVLIPDAKFGAQPLSVKSRGDYISVKLEGIADDYIQSDS